MKPDFGLQLLREGINQDISLHLYGVTFHTIDFLAPNSYSIRVDRNYFRTAHAVTFEFDDEIMVELLSRLRAPDRENFGMRVLDRRPPFSEDLPVPVKIESIECQIGSVQSGANEPFVPLRIVAIK